jgi:hypothetical protein
MANTRALAQVNEGTITAALSTRQDSDSAPYDLLLSARVSESQ